MTAGSTFEGTTHMHVRLAVVTAIAGPLLVGAAVPAVAAPTLAAPLTCGSEQYEVTGFGRGQVLQVVGSTDVFVVTRAELPSGVVVFDNPGLADGAGIVDCTATSPVSGTSFAFSGFFTPRS